MSNTTKKTAIIVRDKQVSLQINESNRKFSDKKARLKSSGKEQIQDYCDSYIGAGDPTCAMMDHEEHISRKIGVDIFELCMMEEDWSAQ